jgi:hypothetical protein
MDGDGLLKIRRSELLARVRELEKLIGEHRGRVQFMRQMGYSAALAAERLNLLERSLRAHLSALKELQQTILRAKSVRMPALCEACPRCSCCASLDLQASVC